MSKYIDLYNQKKKTAAGAIEMIRNRDWIFTAQAAAEPVGILQELQHLKDTGVRDIILNTCLPIGYALREEDRWSWRQFLRWMTVDI